MRFRWDPPAQPQIAGYHGTYRTHGGSYDAPQGRRAPNPAVVAVQKARPGVSARGYAYRLPRCSKSVASHRTFQDHFLRHRNRPLGDFLLPLHIVIGGAPRQLKGTGSVLLTLTPRRASRGTGLISVSLVLIPRRASSGTRLDASVTVVSSIAKASPCITSQTPARARRYAFVRVRRSHSRQPRAAHDPPLR